jgi:hypothetical protein
MTALTKPTLPPDFMDRTKRVWEEYQRSHDITPLKGQIAAIDPDTGRVWIGPDGLDMVDRMKSDGVEFPVYMVRVGYDYMYVKGRR